MCLDSHGVPELGKVRVGFEGMATLVGQGRPVVGQALLLLPNVQVDLLAAAEQTRVSVKVNVKVKVSISVKVSVKVKVKVKVSISVSVRVRVKVKTRVRVRVKVKVNERVTGCHLIL